MDLGTTVEHTLHRQTLFALRLAKRPGEVHSKPACHADRPGRAGVANADRESKLVGMPVPWTCDLDRTSRSCRVFCSLQCMACVHWSTQATAAALVHRQMAMRPLWRRSNAEEGHRHWASVVFGRAHTHIFWKKRRPAAGARPLYPEPTVRHIGLYPWSPGQACTWTRSAPLRPT